MTQTDADRLAEKPDHLSDEEWLAKIRADVEYPWTHPVHRGWVKRAEFLLRLLDAATSGPSVPTQAMKLLDQAIEWLDEAACPDLCREISEFLVRSTAPSGGHLARDANHIATSGWIRARAGEVTAPSGERVVLAQLHGMLRQVYSSARGSGQFNPALRDGIKPILDYADAALSAIGTGEDELRCE